MKAAQRDRKCVRSRKKRQESGRVVVLVVKNSAKDGTYDRAR